MKTPLLFTSVIKRRQFLSDISRSAALVVTGAPLFSGLRNGARVAETEPLMDWALWEKYRTTVVHPALAIKTRDITNARENIRKFEWAGNYAKNVDRTAQFYLSYTEPDQLRNLIEETTPGDPLWTPCPSCRAKGKPVHPHGLWKWDISTPDQLTCTICLEVFPHHDFPENIIVTTKWKKPQKLSYYGGDTFVIFGFKQGRPSFTANIRSRKVQWVANYSRTLAEAFILTGKIEYAIRAKDILVRLAECYPNWLVHVGYGEYADMDPRLAAQAMKNLPEPEITPAPNKPDNALWTAFWSAGRASGVGLESDFIRKVVEAYDLTCMAVQKNGTKVYTESQRLKIEKDLLLESTILLVSDKLINNKSVSNRTAVALVGLCTGHPGLVRFGLEGFDKTVNEWFLPDGTTSESAFYGLMTLGGIWDMAQASRGYSDPAGYRDGNGARIDSLNLYQTKSYARVLQSFFNGLQGDLKYPPYADSFLNLPLDSSYVDLMVANYPDRPEYLALLRELCGRNLELPSGPAPLSYFQESSGRPEFIVQTLPYDLAKPNGSSSFSLYYRKPNLSSAAVTPLILKDWNPSDLKIAHLRTGSDGRESLLTLSASPWGNHHESDSLNLYYWKKGAEILSDLGYLWDHPLKYKTTMRSLAHQTVLINGLEQRTKERAGSVLYFKVFPKVKMVEASSEAYAETSVYKRTTAIIDHGNGRDYVVDFFRVQGGDTQDYVFHTRQTEQNVQGISFQPVNESGLYDFKQIRNGIVQNQASWNLTWKAGESVTAKAWSVVQPGEEMYLADGWGQRDWKNSDAGATIPYVVRRNRGAGLKTFVSVFEGYDSPKGFVRDVKFVDGLLVVETENGKDYILSAATTDSKRTPEGHELKGHFACVSVRNKIADWRIEVPEQ